MSKKVQEGAGEEGRVMAESTLIMNLVSKTVERSPTMPSSSASRSPGTLRARNQNLGLLSSTGKPTAGDSNEDTASSSQAWQSNANLDRSMWKSIATGKTQKVNGKNWPRRFQISYREYIESHLGLATQNWS